MDKGIILPIIAFLLSIYLLANLIPYNIFLGKWQVDPTGSIISSDNLSINKLISPPKTAMMQIEGKKAIYPIHITREQIEGLANEPGFKYNLKSDKKLISYKKGSVSLILASNYFNEEEIEMLSNDNRVEYLLYNVSWDGTIDVSYIDAKDPTNAKLESIYIDNESNNFITSYNMEKETLLKIENSTTFKNALKEIKKTKAKGLFMYRDAESGSRVIIPTGFSNDEVGRLLKSKSVKTALSALPVQAGKAVNLNSTPEFNKVDMASLPYNLDAGIHVTFNPISVDFIPPDWLVYTSLLIAVLLILYLIYRLLL